jgi:putative peptidoglycan lipid II flippase
MDWGVNLGLMLSLPAAVAMYLLAQPLIAALFMIVAGGAMTLHDVRMAGYALEMFAIALPAFVLVKILAPAFFAQQDTKSPFRYATGAVIVNLVGSLSTFYWFGHVGLAWATALSAWAHVVLLYLGLKRRGLYVATVKLWPHLWRTLVACCGLGIGLYIWVVPVNWLELSEWERLRGILLTSGVGVCLYLVVLYGLGIRPRDLKHVSRT